MYCVVFWLLIKNEKRRRRRLKARFGVHGNYSTINFNGPRRGKSSTWEISCDATAWSLTPHSIDAAVIPIIEKSYFSREFPPSSVVEECSSGLESFQWILNRWCLAGRVSWACRKPTNQQSHDAWRAFTTSESKSLESILIKPLIAAIKSTQVSTQ